MALLLKWLMKPSENPSAVRVGKSTISHKSPMRDGVPPRRS
jgi:hypothetical protein